MSFSSGRNLQNNINTTEAQTLSNKTLDNTTVIQSGADIQTPAIIDPSRSDVKKDTLANLQTYASSASNGQLCYATDSKKMFQVLDSALSDVGGGASGINYITNPDAEVNADGWNNYANTTPGVLPDDFLGTVNGGWSNIAASPSSPLRGSKSFAFGGINGGANDLQGHGVYSSFTVDSADLAKKLTISFDYLIDDSALTNAVDGMLRVYIYDEDKSQLIRVNGEDIQLNANSGTHYAQFQTDSVSTNYRLVIHQALALNVAEDYTIRMDNVKVGPTVIAKGTIVTDWIDFTPTGTWVSGNETYTGKYRRVGDSAEIQYNVNLTGAPTATILAFDPPSGLTFDNGKKPTGATTMVVGGGEIKDAGTNAYHCRGIISGNTVSMRTFKSDATNATLTSVTNIVPHTFANNDSVSVTVLVPIAGWSSNAKMSEDLGGREVVVEARGNGAETLIGNVTNTPFITEKDTTSSWDGAIFTAPETGTYSIEGALNSSGIDMRYFSSWVDTGSGFVVVNSVLASPTVSQYSTFSDGISLNKGDKYAIRSENTITLSNFGRYHWIQIKKDSSPQTILETETVAARYTSNSGQSIGSGTEPIIVFEDITADTHNAYNTSTGEYTVPVGGWYSLNSLVTFAALNRVPNLTIWVNIYLNGVESKRVQEEETGTDTGIAAYQASDMNYYEKGDVITIRVYQNTGTSESLSTVGSRNVFSIHRIK